MDEIVNQYLPQIITAIVGVVSTGGCAGLLTYLTRQFNKLKGSTEIAQIRDMTHKIVETNKSLVAENLALKQELEELAWSRRKPSVNHLKVFGCICFARVPKVVRHKLDEDNEKCIFVGYSSKSKGYKLFSLKRNKVIVCKDVIFDENAFWD